MYFDYLHTNKKLGTKLLLDEMTRNHKDIGEKIKDISLLTKTVECVHTRGREVL